MSKRSYTDVDNNNGEMDLPTTCLVCDSNIIRNSVLFHCECVVVLCSACALQLIAAQTFTYHRGIICPYCRQYSDNLKGVDTCQAEEDRLIVFALQRYGIRSSRHDDGIKKALMCLIRDGYTMGSSKLSELEESEKISAMANLSLRLELARIASVLEQRLTGNSLTMTDLPLGPLRNITITRNFILERAIGTEVPVVVKRPVSIVEDTPGDDSSIQSIHSYSDEVVDDGAISSDDRRIYHGKKRGRKKVMTDEERMREQTRYPLLPSGTTAVICGGILAGRVGTVIGYTNSGDSVRIQFVDDKGNLKRTAVLRKNIRGTQCEESSPNADTSSAIAMTSEGATSTNGKLQENDNTLCLCKTSQHGIYVQCRVGTRGCNGWVHPRCCSDLKKCNFSELQKIDGEGYVCPLCKNSQRSLAPLPDNATPVKDGLIRWIDDVSTILPVLVGRNVTTLASFQAINLLYTRGLQIYNLNRTVHTLFDRLNGLIQRLAVIDNAVTSNLDKCLSVLIFQRGLLNDDTRRRNLLERKLGRLLHMAYESHTKLGLKCTAIHVILRTLAWCNQIFNCLPTLTLDMKYVFLIKSIEYRNQAFSMPRLETFGGMRKPIASNERSVRNEMIAQIVDFLLEYWINLLRPESIPSSDNQLPVEDCKKSQAIEAVEEAQNSNRRVSSEIIDLTGSPIPEEEVQSGNSTMSTNMLLHEDERGNNHQSAEKESAVIYNETSDPKMNDSTQANAESSIYRPEHNIVLLQSEKSQSSRDRSNHINLPASMTSSMESLSSLSRSINSNILRGPQHDDVDHTWRSPMLNQDMIDAAVGSLRSKQIPVTVNIIDMKGLSVESNNSPELCSVSSMNTDHELASFTSTGSYRPSTSPTTNGTCICNGNGSGDLLICHSGSDCISKISYHSSCLKVSTDKPWICGDCFRYFSYRHKLDHFIKKSQTSPYAKPSLLPLPSIRESNNPIS